jgi:hypothetical protein
MKENRIKILKLPKNFNHANGDIYSRIIYKNNEVFEKIKNKLKMDIS